MAFTPVEIIALIVIIASAIKMVMLVINPKGWMNMAKGIYSKPFIVRFVALVLAAIVLYYLLMEITIVQIIATTAFVALLVLIGLAAEVEPLIKKYEALIKKGKLWKEYWFYALIWILLMVWALVELF